MGFIKKNRNHYSLLKYNDGATASKGREGKNKREVRKADRKEGNIGGQREGGQRKRKTIREEKGGKRRVR